MVSKLQKLLKDRDYIRVEGELVSEQNKETKITSTYILVKKVGYVGTVDFKDKPQMTFTATAGMNAYDVTTDKEIVNAVSQDEVPF